MSPDLMLGPWVLVTLLTLAITEAFNFHQQQEDKNIYVKNRQVVKMDGCAKRWKFWRQLILWCLLFLELPSELLPVCDAAVYCSLNTPRISQFPALLFLISAFCQSSQDLKICIKWQKHFCIWSAAGIKQKLFKKLFFLSLSHLFFFDDIFFHMLFTLTLTHVTLMFHHFQTLKW